MNVDNVLANVLGSVVGFVNVYPLQRPANSPLPALVYGRISDKGIDNSHSGGGHLHRGRFQITHVASSYANLRSLVDSVKALLEGNHTNFQAAMTSDIHIETKEADNVFVAQKDYLIWWSDV